MRASLKFSDNIPTLTSFNAKISVVKVVFTTEGLFFTLGNIMPPLRETGLIDDVDAVEEEKELLLDDDVEVKVVEEVVWLELTAAAIVVGVVGVVKECVPETELANITLGVVFDVKEEEWEFGLFVVEEEIVEGVGVAASEAVEGVVWKVDVVGDVLLCAP